MKISRRMMEKKMKSFYWQGLREGQEQGRQESMDIACSWIGRASAQAGNDSGLLHAHAFIEGMRLLSYHYEEMPVEEVCAFRERFIDARNSSRGEQPCQKN